VTILQPNDPAINASNVSAATNSAPLLTPDAVAGVAATANGPIDASVKAIATQQAALAQSLSTELTQQSEEFQTQWWNKASNAVKSLIGSFGYKPPTAPAPQGSGIWNTFVHGLDDIRHAGSTALHDTVGEVAHYAGDVFNAAAAPIGQLERASFANAQDQILNSPSSNGWDKWYEVLNPVDILQHWNSVSNGQSSFQPEALAYVKKFLIPDDATLQLAKTYAATGSLQATLASLPANERANAYGLIQSNKDFGQAVQLLSDSHLSLGQMVFGGLNPTQFKKLEPGSNSALDNITPVAAQAATIGGEIGAVAVSGGTAGAAEGGAEAAGGVRGIVSGLGTARTVAATGILGSGAAGIAASQLSGETVDQSTTMAPFGAAIHPLSGVADGFVSWYGNPLQQALVGAGAYKSAIHSMATFQSAGTAEDVMAHYANVPSAQDFAVKAARSLVTPFMRNGELVTDEPNIALAREAGVPIESQGQIDQIARWFPEIKKAADEGHPETAIAQMMASSDAMVQTFMGRSGKFFHNSTVFPHVTLPQAIRDKIMGFDAESTGWTGRRFNIDKLTPTQASTELLGPQLTEEGIADAKAALPLTAPVRFTQRVTTLVPLQKFISFGADPTDAAKALFKAGAIESPEALAPNNLTTIERLASFALPKQDVAAAINGYAAIPTEERGLQRAFVMGLINNMAYVSGVTDSQAGRDFMERWQARAYGTDDNDLIVNPFDREGPRIPAALLTTQFADAMSLPDFREWYKFAKKSWFMSLFHAGLNAQWVDKFMSAYWKPALLLRSGFAFRFAGEEDLNFVLRNGIKSLVQSGMARTAEGALNARQESRVMAVLNRANSVDNLDEFGNPLDTWGPLLRKAQTQGLIPDSAKGISEINMLDAKRLFDALATDVPEEIWHDSFWQGKDASLLNKRDRYLAVIHAFPAIKWANGLRVGLYRALTPNDILDYAHELAQRGTWDTSFGDRVSAYLSHGSTYLGDEVKGIRTDEGLPVSITNSMDYATAPRGSKGGVVGSDEIGNWHFRLSGLTNDPIARAAAKGYMAGGEQGAIQGAIDFLSARGLRNKIEENQKTLDEHMASFSGKGNPEQEERTKELLGYAKSLQGRLTRHESLLKNSPRYSSVNGERVLTGETTRDLAIRQWAEDVWREVKTLTFTPHGQDFEDVDGEAQRIPVAGESEPIRLPDTVPGRMFWQIVNGDTGRPINLADESTAYFGVPKGHVRLFHGRNVDATTGADFSTEVAPGRSWSPSYERASRHAGEDGDVYQIDVPAKNLKAYYKYHPHAPDDVITAQEDARLAELRERLPQFEESHANAVSAERTAVENLNRIKSELGSAKEASAAIKDVHIAQKNLKTLDAQLTSAREQLAAGSSGDVLDRHIRGLMDDQQAGANTFGKPPKHMGSFESGDIGLAKSSEETKRTIIGEIARTGERGMPGVTPDTSELSRIESIHVPENITAPARIVTIKGANPVASIVDKGMRAIVGRPADWMSRQPAFLYNYAMSRREVDALLKARGIVDKSGDLAHEISMERATNETITYLHDPRARSQFAEVTRNLMPFWFAQEQWYKRWSRLFGTYPEAWYKLQQTMNGLRSVGFVTKDSYGQDSFVYPGSQAMLHLLSKVFGADLPVSVGLTGEINQLNPSLATGAEPWPAWGPIATIPMIVAGGLFPSTDGLVQKMLGPSAPPVNEHGNWKTDAINQLLPSIEYRTQQWLTSSIANQASNPTVQSIYMQSMIQAAQYLEANGHGLPANANPTQTQNYIDRISNWAQNLMLFRTMAGFFGPATPTFKFNDNGLGAQLQALLANTNSTFTYSDAIAAFIKAHPNATAYTLFSSTTAGDRESGTYVPATEAAANWLTSNATFVSNYPQLAPWLMPASTAQGAFSGTAYQQELNLHLRGERPLYDAIGHTGWYNQLKYSEGANVYFPMEAAVKTAEAQPGADVATLRQEWHNWSTSFKNSHPIFASMLTDPTAKNRRTAIIGEINQALVADALPQGELSQRLGELMAVYNQTVDAYNQTAGNSAYAQQHREAKLQMIAYGNAFAQDYPVVAPLWNGVLSQNVPG